MSLVLLPNTWGDQADDIELGASDPDILDGFALDRIISGGRHDAMSVMTEESTSNTGFRYTNSTAIPWTHMVVCRADRVLQSNLTVDLDAYADDGGGNTNLGSFTELVGYDFFNKGYGQDSVYALSSRRTSDDRVEVRLNTNDLCSKQINKFYVSDAFTFGSEPELRTPPKWEELSNDATIFRPLNGFITYKVHSQLTLTWTDVTRSKVSAFLNLPQILNWPIFLYDDTGDIFPWKLEHAIISNYNIYTESPDYSTVSINLLRLEHYR